MKRGQAPLPYLFYLTGNGITESRTSEEEGLALF